MLSDFTMSQPEPAPMTTRELRRLAYITPELRAAVYDRDGHQCRQCGTTKKLSVDHIHPLSRGGPTTMDNLQTLCIACNCAKGDSIGG